MSLGTLQSFLKDKNEKGKFASESGHSVILFGKDYYYTGARRRGAPNPIPGPIFDVIEKIYSEIRLRLLAELCPC